MEDKQVPQPPEAVKWNHKAVAEEIKKFVMDKKLDLIDYSYANIDCWPPVDDPLLPEFAKVCRTYEAWFNYADQVTDEDGNGFPTEAFARLDKDLKEIEAIINADKAYWRALRKEVIPLYERSPHFAMWKKRWRCVDLFYDPIPMQVQTTKIFRDPLTDEIKKKEVVSTRVIPAGVVVRIDKTQAKMDQDFSGGGSMPSVLSGSE